MNTYIFSCTLTFETVIKAATQDEAEMEFIRSDGQRADVVYDSGVKVQVVEGDLYPAEGLISDNAGNSALSVRKTPTIWGN